MGPNVGHYGVSEAAKRVREGEKGVSTRVDRVGGGENAMPCDVLGRGCRRLDRARGSRRPDCALPVPSRLKVLAVKPAERFLKIVERPRPRLARRAPEPTLAWRAMRWSPLAPLAGVRCSE